MILQMAKAFKTFDWFMCQFADAIILSFHPRRQNRFSLDARMADLETGGLGNFHRSNRGIAHTLDWTKIIRGGTKSHR